MQPTHQPGLGAPAPTGYGVGPQPGLWQHSPAAMAQRPGIMPLRPQGLSDILEASFAALRLSPAAILGTMLIVALIETLLTMLPVGYLFGTIGQSELFFSTVGPSGPNEAQVWEVFGIFMTFGGLMLLAAILMTFIGTISQGVLSVVVARGAVGLKTSLGQAWRLTAPTMWSLVGLTALYFVGVLIYTAVMGGGLLLAMIPAMSSNGDPGMAVGLMFLVALAAMPLVLWIGVKVMLAPAAVSIEGIGPWAAIRRSWSLTQGSWWRTFGIVLLVVVIVSIVVSLISGGLASIIGMFAPSAGSATTLEGVLEASTVSLLVTTVVSTLFQTLGIAYLTMVLAVLFIDYRIRRESFDLELGQLADQAGTTDQDARFSAVAPVPGQSISEQLVPGRGHRAAAGPAQSR